MVKNKSSLYRGVGMFISISVVLVILFMGVLSIFI